MKKSVDIEELKKKHGSCTAIEVKLHEGKSKGEVLTIYLKKPDRIMNSMVSGLIDAKDPLDAIEVFLNGCYIGGDELKPILDDFLALKSCTKIVAEMLSVEGATLKKN